MLLNLLYSVEMAEDTNWLKKNPIGNPFRMSLRRSSRFYAQDMDGSIMANEDAVKNQVLVVSHMPRRSNIPIEKIKQMDFKIPAQISKRSGIKKPVTRMSKFSLGQNSFSRPSTYLKPSLSKYGTELQNQSSKKLNLRSSTSKLNQANDCLLSVPKQHVARTISENPDSCSKMRMQNSADLSILSQSQIVNQSTPYEAGVLRGILKRNEHSEMECIPAGAKLDNFYRIGKEDRYEKENDHSFSSESAHEKEVFCDTDESTVAFMSSFKPILNEVKPDKDKKFIVDFENIPVKEKNSELSDSNRFIIGAIIDVWKAYRSRLNDIWTQLRLNDEEFKRNLSFVLENDLHNKFSFYENEKCRLYEELKRLEKEFRDQLNNKIDLKCSFLSYLEKKADIYKAKAELEENFEKVLSAVTELCLGKEKENGEEKEETSRKKPVTKKTLSPGRRKSGPLIGTKAKAVKRDSKYLISGSNSRPEEPARRRKLSRKVEE